jgi:hypothetical protein
MRIVSMTLLLILCAVLCAGASKAAQAHLVMVPANV